MYVVCWKLYVESCMLYVESCMLYVCCMSKVVCCMLYVCCMLKVVCCIYVLHLITNFVTQNVIYFMYFALFPCIFQVIIIRSFLQSMWLCFAWASTKNKIFMYKIHLKYTKRKLLGRLTNTNIDTKFIEKYRVNYIDRYFLCWCNSKIIAAYNFALLS